MAKSITIVDFDDDTGDAEVIFEDDAGNIIQAQVLIPNDIVDEPDVMDFLSAIWPEEQFTYVSRPQGSRNPHVSGLKGQKTDVSDRVNNPQANPRSNRFEP